MKVLVVGGGGREHALCWKLKQSPLLTKLYCAPGNPGTAEIAENVDLSPSNIGLLALWAVENMIDLTIIGPEAPLVDGITDIFTDHGLKVFGPTKAAAKLEGSKAFAREVMKKAGVKMAEGQSFTDFNEAAAYLKKHGAPIVVKADGLAAGKGVVVAETEEQALAALESCMKNEAFGAAGKTVVLEERLVGEEASVMVLVDGETVLPLVVSQDFKRLLDGDNGPNTGGMGAISPSPILGEKRLQNLVGEIFLPVIRELWTRGIPYRGFLYAGVMVDKAGVVNVLEFNCRLGDPETQVLMMRLQSDLLAVLNAAVNGKLSTVDLKWSQLAAACVVACSEGYPGTVKDGVPVSGLFDGTDELMVFQAGTAFGADGKQVITKGGRVLAVTASGPQLSDAITKAYSGIEKVSFKGMQYRRDIHG